MNGSILVVEDRDSLRRMMRRALEEEGYGVTTASDGPEAERLIAGQPFDLVLTDLKLPNGSGLDVVAAVRAHQARVPVTVITGFGTVGDAVEAMKRGAADFLEKPLDIDQLYALVRNHLSGDESEDLFSVPGAPPIVGRHPALRAALRLVEKVAPTTSTVLITGESGTGKELIARALHALSPRSTGPFVAVNCAALPESLIENELFGHEKGAYTGADRRAAGRFEQASGGTLFLDEIGELPLGVQGKILRVIEEREIERVGGSSPVRTDVRLLAATNRDLAEMTENGRFRTDLFYRLEVFPITLPPLRDRAQDIPRLARHLIARITERLGGSPPTLTPAAEALLAGQIWPGNVRQLANLLERALILGDTPRLDARDIEPLLGIGQEDERTTVRRALEDTGGDKKAAAERLGVSYRTLQRKIRAFDLEGVPRYR